MAEEYKVYVDLIEEFDNYSQETIIRSEAFQATVSNLANKAGSLATTIGSFAQDVLISNNNTSITKGLAADVAANYGKEIFGFLGKKLGEFNKNSKYKKAQSKILEEGLEFKEKAYNMIPKAVEAFAKYSDDVYDQIIEKGAKEIQKLTNLYGLCKFSDKNLVSLSNTVEAFIRKIYQFEYRKRLADKILIYFDNFQEKLEDFEGFSVWYQEEIIVDKVQCYNDSYYSVKEKLEKKVSEGNAKRNLSRIFINIQDSLPIMLFDDREGKYDLPYSMELTLKERIKDENYNPDYGQYYNKMIDISANYYSVYVKDKIKKTGLKLLLLMPLLGAVVSFLINFIVVLTTNYGFNHHFFGITFYTMLNNQHFLPVIISTGSLLVIGLGSFIAYYVNKRKHPVTACLKVCGEEYIFKLYEICEQCASDEKEKDTAEIDKLLLGDNETPAAPDGNETDNAPAVVDEEDLLSDIIGDSNTDLQNK